MPVDRFEIMRQRIRQQGTAEAQAQAEAMRRRFASAGGLSSGAAMRAENQVAGEAQKRAAEGMQGVDIAQAQEQFQTEQEQKNRDFAREERLGSQEFAKGERMSSQDFAAAQRAAAEEFQAKENGLSRQLQESMFNKEYELKRQQLQQEKDQFAASLDWEAQKFEHEKEVDAFNRAMAERVQKENEKPSGLEQLGLEMGKPFRQPGTMTTKPVRVKMPWERW